MRSNARRLVIVFVGSLAICAVLAVSPVAAWADPAQNQRCFACHAHPELVSNVRVVDSTRWMTSAHSQLDCTSCHIGFKPHMHTAAEKADAFQQAQVASCGNCHANELRRWGASVHGKIVAALGIRAGSPTCGACHDPHMTALIGTQVARQRMTLKCEGCHGGKARSFRDTYHGQAFALGDTKTAVCADCHGSHSILPASDPASTVSKRNLVSTCRKCHADANASFVTYMVHVDPADPHSSLLVWMSDRSHLLLIGFLFAFGAVHCCLYFYRGMKEGLYLHGKH